MEAYMTIKLQNILFCVFTYLLIPICLFIVSWLSFVKGVLICFLLLVGAYYVFHHVKKIYMQESIRIDHWFILILIILASFLLCTGHGEFIGANGVDIPWRDAIYYDLISHSWPVVYESNEAALTYYLTYWLPIAGITSILEIGRVGAQAILFFWTLLGLYLGALLLCHYVQACKKETIVSICIFIFWSGLSILGMIIRSMLGKNQPLMIDNAPGFSSWRYSTIFSDGYFIGYFIRTTFDSVANVYNQFIPVLLCTLLFLYLKKEYKLYAFIGLLVLPYSPFGFLGLSIMMIIYFLSALMKQGNRMFFFKQCFSFANITALCTILPVYYLYYTSNIISEVTSSSGIFAAPLRAYGLTRVSNLFLFYLLSFGIYVFCLRPTKKDVLLWISVVILCVLPFFKIGVSADLLWNASVAPYLIIMIAVIKRILKCIRNKNFWGRDLCLALCLCIAMLTPFMQASSTLRASFLHKSRAVYLDPNHVNGTFEGKEVKEYKNFLSHDYKNSLFYLYLGKHD